MYLIYRLLSALCLGFSDRYWASVRVYDYFPVHQVSHVLCHWVSGLSLCLCEQMKQVCLLQSVSTRVVALYTCKGNHCSIYTIALYELHWPSLYL
ncbi:hypothetical protein FKM82_024763 [Ascaphus truei]